MTSGAPFGPPQALLWICLRPAYGANASWLLIWSKMFFRISSSVRLPPYQILLDVEPLNGLGVVAAKARMPCTDRDADPTAPAVNALVDGVLFRHVAVPVLRLSTIGQTAVKSITKEPSDELAAKKTDGGFVFPTAVDVHPGPLK